MSSATTQGFLTHIAELRKRLLKALIGLALCFAACAYFSPSLFHYLSLPLLNQLQGSSNFITTHPVEAWWIYFKTALLSAIFLASPIIFYQLWAFVSQGLLAQKKKPLLRLSLMSAGLFIIGLDFAMLLFCLRCLNIFLLWSWGAMLCSCPKWKIIFLLPAS